MQKWLQPSKPTLVVVVAGEKVKTQLWYMQEDRESFGQANLGTNAKILGPIVVYSLRFWLFLF